MIHLIEKRVADLNHKQALESIRGIRRGIEKESLRVTPDGHLSQTQHPNGLGSALTHPAITTDYSEALLELITPAFTQIEETLEHLENTHAFVYRQIGDELLWVNSMPCIMGEESAIPIAQYGSSNIGRMKTIYRKGLGHRYGRLMQTIAGIHYNFSFPSEFWQHYQLIEKDDAPLQAFISHQYFHLVRNFQRFTPLIIYLFGASPAVCASFLKGRNHSLAQHISSGTLYLPHATSLRMSDLGYQNDTQSGLDISYNSVQEYAGSLIKAMSTSFAPYEKFNSLEIPHISQLSSNILQIENEYYGQIRPKRTTHRGERPTTALLQRGVEYVEMRCLDLNPFLDVGIDAEQMRFLDIFAFYCLLHPSPHFTVDETSEIKANNQAVVLQGRNPNINLKMNGESSSLISWANKIWPELKNIATLLDQSRHSGGDYATALHAQYEKLESSDLTPSAKILNILEENKINFFEFAMDKAKHTAKHFRSKELKDSTQNYYKQLSQSSLFEQKQLEEQDQLSFKTYLHRYLNS